LKLLPLEGYVLFEISLFCDIMNTVERVVWVFYGYVTLNGKAEVQQWFEDLDDAAQDELRDNLAYLRVLPYRLWNMPRFKSLGGGLTELRFKVSSLKKTFRIYGFCFPPSRFCYTLLLGTEKKVKNPKSDIKEANHRKRLVESSKVKVNELDI
jgi:hypothetical protein